MDADPAGVSLMTGRLLAAVLRQAEALAGGAAPEPPDADLVRRFVRAERRGRVRRAVAPARADGLGRLPQPARRRVRRRGRLPGRLPGPGPRRPRRLRNPAAVGAWLHGAAVRVATQAKRTAARRKQREQAAAVPEGRSDADPDWAELHAAVHEEVDRLPARERAVFVLCGLGGVRQPDAAARLGVKVSTVSGLLARARKRLLDRLTARGLAPAVAAAAAGVGVDRPGGGAGAAD